MVVDVFKPFNSEMLHDLCDRCSVPSVGYQFIDIGASEGMYSNAGYHGKMEVHAFEPRRNAEWELPEDRATVYKVALSDFNGKTVFHQTIGRRRTSRLASVDRDWTNNHTWRKVEKYIVPVKKLDYYNFDRVSFIKLDVEGAELNVLKGARETIKRCNPAIMIEIDAHHHETLDYLQDLNYQCVAFVARRKIFSVQGPIVFSTGGGVTTWACRSTEFNPNDEYFRREHKRDKDIYNYDRELPLWGDFIFKKV